MSVLNRTSAWWALTTLRGRLTAVGAAAIIGALVTTSAIVWNSPANPIVQSVAAVDKSISAVDRVTAERDALINQVAALQKMLDTKSGSLMATKAQLSDIQQQLWSAQGKLDAAARASAVVAPPVVKKKPAPRVTTAAVVTAPSKAAILSPSSSYFGLYTEQSPFNFAGFDATAARIGSNPNVAGYFGGWDQTYRGDVVTSSWKRGLLPLLTWESRPIEANNSTVLEPDYTLPKIIGDPSAGVPGAFDAYLHQYAKDIVATGLPLAIRLDHEMNGIWYPWAESDAAGNSLNGNRPGDYVKMWQHVHDIFQQEGANNLVVWLWAPNIVNNLPQTHKSAAFLAGLYPGDAYVDLVGLSGYLRPAYKADNDFTFDYTFGPSLTQLRSITTKKIFLAEIGASDVGGHKPTWITSLFSSLAKPENDDILGFSWFNLAVTSYTEGQLATNDWRIESRPENLAAFQAGLAADPKFHLTPH